MQRHVKFGQGFVLILAAIVVVGLVGMFYVPRTAPQTIRPDLQVYVTPTPTSGPCAHLSGTRRETSFNFSEYVGMQLSDYVSRTHVVAKVEISDIKSPRFETLSGSPPPPATATSSAATKTPTGNEEIDDDDLSFFPEDRILRPVVLDATQIYSGTSVTGYVVAKWGGAISGCPDYTYSTNGDVLTGAANDIGMVFLYEPPEDWETEPPNWFSHLQAIADGLSQENVEYRPMLIQNWYLYNTSAGTAATIHPSGNYTISELEAEIEDLTE